ncbi:hypothetical protein ThrDRAFT_01567 [Frankia casuarinae]|uniref:Septum site determining protein n=2 Tax=Frankia casuarinae (strain DSM 45818 / CECT 9043 / HFP020203 / CcI3) TaxID=106370 RepID=Q2J500_FRACC|nr:MULTISPECIES: septum site-determining protein Ssd [Frankia]ABD13642.1 putative septum site determining protein [Frankia casuarinae]ETA02595.1 hypothetical protein CcI6DRAFT_01983 [Frankia sp. CcI6]EYT92791.1 hypothetical protein ThrDRAFT_01567 [Frankia casuarinae]KDA43251.1 hypothetical protein BMG523Draft_01939 [Frankia sp. BMG5.23]OHV49619.1 hypothetical protein CgIS1_05235 [Frankia sp. CgIS1]
MSPAPPLLTAAENHGPVVRPLIVTAIPDLLDDLLRLAAAAGVSMTVAAEMSAVRRNWTSAPLVIVGMDEVEPCIAATLPDRRHVVLVGGHVDDGRVWDASVRIGADHVVFLPEAEPWLVDLLSDLDGLDRHRSVTLGIIGGRGGTGASTLAVSLALAGLRHDLRTMLIDADPHGGGLAPAFTRLVPSMSGAFPGGETSSLAPLFPTRHDQHDQMDGSGPVGPIAWSDRLPRRGDLSVVSWDPAVSPAVPPATMATLLATARCTSDLVILDLPGRGNPAATAVDAGTTVALRTCQTVLIVTPADLPSIVAAERVCSAAIRRSADVRAVVRLHPSDRLTPEAIATMLGVPLAGVISSRRHRSVPTRDRYGGSADRNTIDRLSEELLTRLCVLGPRVWPDPEAWS